MAKKEYFCGGTGASYPYWHPQTILLFIIMLEGIIVGVIAGAIAGWIMRGEGYGFIKNLILGLFGGCLGGWAFEKLGIAWGGILGSIGTAVVGAVVLIWIARRISK